MSSVISASEVDFSAVFFDTSVLLDFTLQEDDGSAEELLDSHPSSNVTGKTVEREYIGVKERREKVVKSLLECTDLEDWEPPSSVDMSDNDISWCIELISQLHDISDRSKVERRISLEERRMNRARDSLFGDADRMIDQIWNGELNARLLGNLRFIDNDNDRRIICESAGWASDGGSGNLVTSDEDDILDNRERVMEHVDRNRDLQDLFVLSSNEFLDMDDAHS